MPYLRIKDFSKDLPEGWTFFTAFWKKGVLGGKFEDHFVKTYKGKIFFLNSVRKMKSFLSVLRESNKVKAIQELINKHGENKNDNKVIKDLARSRDTSKEEAQQVEEDKFVENKCKQKTSDPKRKSPSTNKVPPEKKVRIVEPVEKIGSNQLENETSWRGKTAIHCCLNRLLVRLKSLRRK